LATSKLANILLDALEDERKAEATYAAVIEKFGPVRPFSNIIEAEQRHAAALERQLARLGIDVPPDPWTGKVAAPASLAQACESAVQGEIENIALYDRLIPMVDDPAARQVMENLQAASRERHLPAFRQCLERERDRRS
jgi:rubrerythrin